MSVAATELRSIECSQVGAETYVPRQRASMREQEYTLLKQLLEENRSHVTLEIGMANGRSTELMCRSVRRFGGHLHTAIDPYQRDPLHWACRGVKRVERAGLADRLELIEEFDFVALPRLVEKNMRFDFVLIDGWHSFDYTMLDLFYADKLLDVGGVLAVHDTEMPAVHRACRFLETHKPYARLSPRPEVAIASLVGRGARRIRQLLGGPQALHDARSRRLEWYSLAAYRKLDDRLVPDRFFAPF